MTPELRQLLLGLISLQFFFLQVRAQTEGEEEEEEDDDDLNVGLGFALVTAAGLSTSIGAGLVYCDAFFRLDNLKFLGVALGFASGVMLYVSFVDLFPEAIASFEDCDCLWKGKDEDDTEGPAFIMATICLFCGVLFTYSLDFVVHAIAHLAGAEGHGHGHSQISLSPGRQQIENEEKVKTLVDTLPNMIDRNELLHQRGSALGSRVGSHVEVENHGSRVESHRAVSKGPEDRPKTMTENPMLQDDEEVAEGGEANHAVLEDQKLHDSTVMTALAIAIHNFPEGLATLAGTLSSTQVGVALAIAIGIHNIPEGLCISIPVFYSTGSKWRGFWMAFWSGVCEIIGAALGYAFLINVIGDATFGVLFSFVGGIMITIVLKELLPTAHRYDPEDDYVTNCVFIGAAVMAFSLVMFTLSGSE